MKKFSAVPDKLFPLPGGACLGAADVAHKVTKTCPYVHRMVLAEENQAEMAALVFPATALFTDAPNDKKLQGCFCPENIDDLARCLSECMDDINSDIAHANTRIGSFAVVQADVHGSAAHQADAAVLQQYQSCLEGPESAPADSPRYAFVTLAN